MYCVCIVLCVVEGGWGGEGRDYKEAHSVEYNESKSSKSMSRIQIGIANTQKVITVKIWLPCCKP